MKTKRTENTHTDPKTRKHINTRKQKSVNEHTPNMQKHGIIPIAFCLIRGLQCERACARHNAETEMRRGEVHVDSGVDLKEESEREKGRL